MRRAFVFDQEKCMGCNTCTVACKDWNQVNPGPVRWRNQYTYELDNSFFPLSMSCNHCQEPACVTACSLDAIKKRDSDGVVFVDKTICQQLRSCITACPFAAPQIAEDEQEPVRYSGWLVDHPMQKCDFCKDRMEEGKEPVCIASCPAHALDMGDYDYMISKYAAKGVTLEPLSPAKHPYAYKNNTDETGPSFLIRKRHTLEIVELKQ